MVSRSLIAFIAIVGSAIVASAQPPSTAPYIQQFPAPVAQMGGGDPYAMAPPPMSSGWMPAMGMGVPVLNEVQDRAWWRAEYLVWWTEGMDLPPLVTSSPAGTPPDEAGVLGFPDTTVLFGNQDVNSGSTGGVRTSSGYWFTPDRRFGIESELFRLRNQSDGYSAAGDGDPIIARPAFAIVQQSPPPVGQLPNPGNFLSVSRLISYPGASEGSIRISTKNKLESYMFGGKFGLTPTPNWQFESCERPSSVHWTLGYRRLKLEDNVHIFTDVTDFDPPRPPTRFVGPEHFATKNKFDGFQLGFTYQTDYQRARLESRMRVAVGNNRQTVNVGATTEISGGVAPPATDDIGFLVWPSNSGNRTRDVFTMIPELGVTLALRLTDRIHGTVGYTVVYFPNVVRAGDQIDTTINTFQQAGFLPVRPSPRFVDNDFWAHGLNFGGELRF